MGHTDRRDPERAPAVYLTRAQLFALLLAIIGTLGGVQIGIYVLALDQHIDGRIRIHNDAKDAHAVLMKDMLLVLTDSDKRIADELVKIRVELAEIKTKLDVTTEFQKHQAPKR